MPMYKNEQEAKMGDDIDPKYGDMSGGGEAQRRFHYTEVGLANLQKPFEGEPSGVSMERLATDLGALHGTAQSPNPKDRVGILKPSIIGVPASALFHLGRGMEDGIDKYGIYNWRESKVLASVYFGAMMRHAWAWWDGEEMVPNKRGEPVHHLGYAMANCAILLDAMSMDMLINDRGKPGRLPQLLKEWERR